MISSFCHNNDTQFHMYPLCCFPLLSPIAESLAQTSLSFQSNRKSLIYPKQQVEFFRRGSTSRDVRT